MASPPIATPSSEMKGRRVVPRGFVSPAVVIVSALASDCFSVVAGFFISIVRDLVGRAPSPAEDLLASGAGGMFAGYFCMTIAGGARRRHLAATAVWTVILIAIRAGFDAYTNAARGLPLGFAVREALSPAWPLGPIGCISLLLGGSAYEILDRGMRRDGRRKTWTYRTGEGVEFTLSSPWRFRAISRAWSALGIVLISVLLVSITLAIAPGRWPSSFQDLVLLVSLGAIGSICYSLGRQTWALSADEALSRDRRAPLIYLRSFGDDGRAWHLGYWHEALNPLETLAGRTVEQRLTRHARKVGPLVAIGRPGEELPELGAARMYVDDAHWRDLIRDFMDKVALVILQVGETPGLRWEVELACSRLKPEQVVLFLPYRSSLAKGEGAGCYERFRAWANPHFPGGLPDSIGDDFLIYFEPGSTWIPRGLRHARKVSPDHPHRAFLRAMAREEAFRRPSFFNPLLYHVMLVLSLILLIASTVLMSIMLYR